MSSQGYGRSGACYHSCSRMCGPLCAPWKCPRCTRGARSHARGVSDQSNHQPWGCNGSGESHGLTDTVEVQGEMWHVLDER
eukprot:606967-Pyramimonas_sp.AAC.2